jgi:2-polyprenyl-3-methyl-5-hydroxy-6-metoxy-1,4-benzoquinol methylase
MLTSDGFDYDLMWCEEKPFADRLAVWIKDALKPSRVVDLGCGPGMYVAALREVGIKDTYGYDIDQRIADRDADGLHCRSFLDLYDPADVTMCIEVAEHIPAANEINVVEAVSRNTRPGGTLIWSAAHPGQGGVGHINCQPKEHWEGLLSRAKMRRDFKREDDMLRWIKSGYHMGWFRLNAMTFVRALA